MKTIKILLIHLLLLTGFCTIHAQNLPTITPPSPQAAQFIRYGEIPVGHTTGVPQIDIPIYTLSTGWIDIPISISYHASGFKTNDIPSPVGLGWVLNAGGLISRSVEMNPDYEEINLTNHYGLDMPIKSAADLQALKNGTKKLGTNGVLDFSKWDNWANWETFFFSSNIPQLDTRSDRYYYNFLGKNGIIRYNVDAKELTTIPYDPIKIGKNGDVFSITDTKGIKYEFSQIEKTSAGAKGTYTSGWYLTKITCPGKESEPVIFSYQDGNSYYDYYSSSGQMTRIIDTRNSGIPGNGTPTTGAPPEAGSYTNNLYSSANYSSPLIQTITWKDVTISFSYASDRTDQRKDRITSLTVKYGNNTVKQAVFDNSGYFGNAKSNYRLKLNGITIKGSNTTNADDKYVFNYYNETASIPNYEYKCHDDYWGYYNGTSSDWRFPNDINIDQATGNRFLVGTKIDHTVPSTNRKPSLESTKTCVLKEIVYPTKGKSVFEYEQNQVSGAYQFMNHNYVGGLRLKQRTNYSDDNTITDVKTYTYEGYPTQVLKNDLFVYYMECIDSYLYSINSGNTWGRSKIEYPIYFFSGTPLTSLSGWTGSNVFYTKIKEYNGSQSSYDGWTEYNYEEENRSLNDQCSWNVEEYPPYMLSKYADCDKGNITGLLKSAITYNKSGSIVKKVEKQYQSFSIQSVHTGVRVFQNAVYGSGETYNPAAIKSFQDRLDYYYIGNVTGLKQEEYQNFYLNRIYAMDTYAFRDVSLPSSVTETDYINGQPAAAKTTGYSYYSQGGKPVSYKNQSPYNLMVTANMLDYPVEEKTMKNNSVFISNSYTKYKQISGNIILPDILYMKYNPNQSFEPRITYHNYDSYGNPVYVVKDDADKVVYLWGYKGLYPIAEIKGATYSEVCIKVGNGNEQTGINTLNTIATKDEPASVDWTTINNLRTQLPNVMVTTYTYKPLVGILTMTDPRGVVTKYEYDTFNRLWKVTQAGRAIEKYDYHYKN